MILPNPIPKLWVVYAVLIVLVLMGAGLSAVWLSGRHAGVAAEKPKVEAATDVAAAQTIQAAGEVAQAQRMQIRVAKPVAAAKATLAPILDQARSAPDANAPLDPDRLSRLRHADDGLCDQSPDLDTCAAGRPGAAAGSAGGG